MSGRRPTALERHWKEIDIVCWRCWPTPGSRGKIPQWWLKKCEEAREHGLPPPGNGYPMSEDDCEWCRGTGIMAVPFTELIK